MDIHPESPEPAQTPAEPENQWFEEVSSRPSTLPPITISLVGFEHEEEAQALGDIVRGFLLFYGKWMNLSDLARVLITHDYSGSLASLERGFEAAETLAPTADDVAVGIAMAPAILENGKVKSVIVLNASHFVVLLHEGNEDLKEYYPRMVYALAHECGHVHDLAVKVRCFPDQWLKGRLSRHDSILFQIAEACWSEYIACRLSAVMSPNETTGDYERTFCQQVEQGFPAIREHIIQYRMHADVSRVLDECTYIVKKMLVYAAYLLGQVAGIGSSLHVEASQAKSLLDTNPTFGSLVERLRHELETLIDSYGKWSDLSVFEPLKKIVLQLFALSGLELEDRREEGVYVNIPITNDTTPTPEQQAAYVVRRYMRRD